MTVHRNAAAGETLTVHPVVDGILRAELSVEAAHHAPPAHVHPQSGERFTVVEGSIWIRVGRARRLLQAGDSVLVPAGAAHGYRGLPPCARLVLSVLGR